LLKRLDSKHGQTLLQHLRSQVAEKESAGANLGFGFEDRTIFVEGREMAREFVKIIAKEIGPIFVGNGFENEAEVEEVFGEREFLGSGEGDW